MKKSCTAKLRNIMRICAVQGMIAITLCGVSAAHSNYAQLLDRELTITLSAVPFEDALKEIENKADVRFFYSMDQLDGEERVNLEAVNMKLGELLERLLPPRNIAYKVHEREASITLKKMQGEIRREQSDAARMRPPIPRDMLRIITGTVTDRKTLQPLSGVNILIHGTTTGTTTDANGKYSIQANDGDVLVFSFIGYASAEIAVKGQNTLDVVLQEDIKSLNDVVVRAGYWDVSKKEQTGNISRITLEDIATQPVTNPLQAMQGRMPGVYISQSSGLPGAGMEIQIRGRSSLRKTLFDDGNLPLYVIDGVPFLSQSLSNRSSYSPINFGSPLNSINPSDIESIEILKDADATAIYGSRGANGVVLITTRKGKPGKTRFELNVYQAAGQVARKMDLLNTEQYLEMRNEAFINDGATPQPWDYDMFWDSGRNVDWQEVLLGGTAKITNARASVSGGTENTQFLISGGFYREGSVMPSGFAFTKGSGHLGITHSSPDKRFKLSLLTNYAKDVNRLADFDPTYAALILPPHAPALIDGAGNLIWENPRTPNPLASLLTGFNVTNTNLINNLKVGYSPIEGFEIGTSLGYSNVRSDEIREYPVSSTDPSWGVQYGQAAFSNGRYESWIIEPTLSYRTDFLNGNLMFLVGSSFQNNATDSRSMFAYGYQNDDALENPAAAASVDISDYRYSLYRYSALFGRINFSWKKMLVVNLTGRRDGSSRFGPDKRFGNFGSVGVGWTFSNMAFFDNLPFLSFGKVRSSYGTTGSDQIGDYGFLDSFSYGTDTYLNQVGLRPTRLANPEYSWETNRKFEIGLELGFLRDRIYLSTSYYHNRSTDQLVGYSLPAITGFTSVQANLPATVQNTGFEVELNTVNIHSGSFTWKTSVNFTLPRNKLIRFDEIEKSPYATTFAVGKSLNIAYRYSYAGIDPDTGLYSFDDKNGNGSLSLSTDGFFSKEIGQEYYGGVHNSLSYKGFQLDVLFQFVKGTRSSYHSIFNFPGAYGNQPVDVLRRWREPGDVADVQRFTQNSYQEYSRFTSSNEAIVDASFIRLKNLSASYRLLFRRPRKSDSYECRIYLQGQNLLTFTNFVGLDPESTSNSLPPLRVLSLGFNLSI